MKRSKIAPTLQRWCSEESMTVDALPAVQAELRAVLAVVSAAQRQADIGNNWPKVLRALARLDRVSKKG